MTTTTTTTSSTGERTLLDLALSAIPDHDRIRDALSRLDAEQLRRANQPAPATTLDLAELLVAGESIPADLGRQLVEANRAAEYRLTEHQAFNQARTHLRGRLDTALLNGADHGLRVLRGELDALLTEARDLAHAVAGLDAEQAIDRAVGAEWRRFGQLADRLREIRSAQRQVMAANGRRPTIGTLRAVQLVSVAGHLRQFATVWPDWRGVGTDRHPAGPDHPAPLPPPWPYDDEDELRPPAATREGLAWLVAHPEAEPWVPTTSEALDAFHAAQRAGRDADADAMAMSPEEIAERKRLQRRMMFG